MIDQAFTGGHCANCDSPNVTVDKSLYRSHFCREIAKDVRYFGASATSIPTSKERATGRERADGDAAVGQGHQPAHSAASTRVRTPRWGEDARPIVRLALAVT